MQNSIFKHITDLNPLPTNTLTYVYNTPNSHFIVVPMQSLIKIYDIRKMNVIFSSPLVYNTKCVVGKDDYIYALADNKLYVLYRGEFVYEEDCYGSSMIIFGDILCVLSRYTDINQVEGKSNGGFDSITDNQSLDCKSSVIVKSVVYNEDEKLNLEMLRNNETHNFAQKISTICHPPTYVNKIVIGYSDGDVEVYNVCKNKSLFRKKLCESEIYLIEPSPILDVLAVVSGTKILFYNIKKDVVLFVIDVQIEKSNKSYEKTGKIDSAKNENEKNMEDKNNKKNEYRGDKNEKKIENGMYDNNMTNNKKNTTYIAKKDNQTDIKIRSLSFKSNGDPHLIVLLSNGTTLLIDLSKKKIIKTYTTNYLSAQYLQGENYLVTISSKAIILHEQLNLTFNQIKIRHFVSNKISTLQFLNDFEVVAPGCDEINTLHLLKEEKNSVYSVKKYRNGLNCSASALGTSFLVNSNSGIYYCDAANKNGKNVAESYFKGFVCAKLSACGNFFCLGTADFRVIVCGAKSGIVYKDFVADKEFIKKTHMDAMSEIETDSSNIKMENTLKDSLDLLNNNNPRKKVFKKNNHNADVDNQINQNKNINFDSKNNTLNEKTASETKILAVDYDIFKHQIIVCFSLFAIIYTQSSHQTLKFTKPAKKATLTSNFILALSQNRLAIIDILTHKTIRQFDIPNIQDYSVTRDLRYLAISDTSKTFIFDVSANTLVDTLNDIFSAISLSDNFFYMCGLTKKNGISMFFNQSMFDPSLLIKNKTFNNNILPHKKTLSYDNNLSNKNNIDTDIDLISRCRAGDYTTILKNNILDNFDIIGIQYYQAYIESLSTKNAVSLIQKLGDYIESDFMKLQRFLFLILKVHAKNIQFESIEAFYQLFVEKFRYFDNKVYKIRGYREYEKRTVIF
ncbi:hypothetical protein EDEG_01287 [Edhazardia aedis USNM 41457]|uniref:WDR36/Utp21 N-terminal domain-containing protein n=1 Tax=Edhazardia aedis (strain USNM 41457) TaxID=1003232 RepID=J9DAG1_EDHAE|nr:hypothetical protein EDEG_01287 [Edhazardia aedis USNM 41457]|eukprot:EJW04494.1 hypothetical protein EDEG_01287 [Edhazardia aedis USNM 41457]